MKPLSNKSSCDPISSNCVIWQGPDIECINICKGDSISEITNKLALELCSLLDDLNVEVYDLACFNLGDCKPEDFKGLIQLLIDKICENTTAIGDIDTGGGEPGGIGCPDCVVDICETFHYVDQLGDTITTMQLQDYVLAIGNRVCLIVGEITTLQNSLTALDGRVTTLENTPPPTFELPELVPACVLPDTTSYTIDVILEALEEQYCNLVQATGSSTDIALALQSACNQLNGSDQLSDSGTMEDLAGWFPNPTNMSQSFSNLWKTLCDARDAVKTIQDTCCAISCEAIDLQFTAKLTDADTLVIDYAGFVPNAFADNGSTVTIAKADGTGSPVITASFNLKATYFDDLDSHTIDLNALGISGEDDLIVTLAYGFIDPTTSLTCGDNIKKRIVGTNACPDVTLIGSFTEALFSFNWIGTAINIDVEVLDQAGTTQIDVQTFTSVAGYINGVFTGLTDGESYQLRLTVDGTQCDNLPFTMASYPCAKPELKTIIKDFETPEGIETGKTINDYVIAYDAAH